LRLTAYLLELLESDQSLPLVSGYLEVNGMSREATTAGLCQVTIKSARSNLVQITELKPVNESIHLRNPQVAIAGQCQSHPAFHIVARMEATQSDAKSRSGIVVLPGRPLASDDREFVNLTIRSKIAMDAQGPWG
jgi:hypothetical protein